jgi:L-seryl-tRNA(Ser) seleniumtransferase
VRKNQFARIVRVGKLTLVALEATLKLFLDESVALREVPTLKMLRRGTSEISRQAEHMVQELNKSVSSVDITTISGFSQMGSGSLPTQNLATTLVSIQTQNFSAESLAYCLRQHSTPIFTRIQNDQVLIDPRTLLSGDDKIVIDALIKIFSKKS